MSLKIVKTLALDFTREAPLEYIFVKAGDKDSRVLDITPLNSGLAYAIPEGAKVVFAAKKPDKTEILNDASVNTKTGHIEVTLSEQTLAAEGILVCEVGLYSAAGEFLSSQHFYLKASPFALTDVESSNEYNSLVVALLSVDAKVREAERKAKEITRAKNSIENSNLIGKLSSCTGKKPELNELFIVEGDSAGGSAKQARDRSFQAILPLRGKPLNAEKKRLSQVLANEEIRTIISALGAGIGEDFNLDSLKYHKVIILSDADQDGAHIRAILLTFFFRYMKELVTNGHLYIGMPPLYKIQKKDKIEYVYSDAELQDAINRVGKGYTLQRYKGLGEMNPEQLWQTTMDPQNRSLMQVSVDDAANAELLITTLMGDNIEARKSYISEHANFNREDKFAGN